MNNDTNAINWFEIPVGNMQRAKHFYQVIFSIHMEDAKMADTQMAMFPVSMGNGKVSGALAQSQFHQPGMQGPVVYLNANPDLSTVLDKITGEGGIVLLTKTLINEETGYMAFFEDMEGNRIGLHAQQ
jgi:predicted enzyme related to lactoylglutathione lyase